MFLRSFGLGDRRWRFFVLRTRKIEEPPPIFEESFCIFEEIAIPSFHLSLDLRLITRRRYSIFEAEKSKNLSPSIFVLRHRRPKNPYPRSATPRIEEPPIFDLRNRRGRRSPSAPWCILREGNVQRLDGGERRQRVADHGVTDKSTILQILDASLQLASSLLDISLCDHGPKGPHSCTSVWLNLMNWILSSTFLKVTISGAPELAGHFHVPYVPRCSLEEVLQLSRDLLW